VSEASELAERHVQAFNDRTWSRASELHAPDLVVIEPTGTSHGIEPFLQHAKTFVTGLPDSRMDVTAIIESGNHVVVEGVYTGTHTGPLATPRGEVPPGGCTLRLPLCDVFEVAAARTTQIHVYYDQMTFAAQLGLLPEPTRAH
jgi:steroid delta-isomerase-like uncharacterized protein